MKKLSFIVLLCAMCPLDLSAQKKTYTTTGGEWIFSFADIKIGGASAANTIRFSPFFNIQTQVHHDLSDRFGILTGFTLHNVGFIMDDPTDKTIYYKFRNYTIGLPLGIKFGDMDGRYFFGGYEIELPFNFKQKTFVNEDKTKYDEWFSSRTPTFYHTLFFGVNLYSGAQLKFKYYLNNWFNKDFTTNDASGNLVKPYATTEVHVFYIALTFQILRGTHFYYQKPKDKSS